MFCDFSVLQSRSCDHVPIAVANLCNAGACVFVFLVKDNVPVYLCFRFKTMWH